MKNKKRVETGRTCAVCGQRRSPTGRKDTYGFKTILARLGMKPGPDGRIPDKAHPECVASLGKSLTELLGTHHMETDDVD